MSPIKLCTEMPEKRGDFHLDVLCPPKNVRKGLDEGVSS